MQRISPASASGGRTPTCSFENTLPCSSGVRSVIGSKKAANTVSSAVSNTWKNFKKSAVGNFVVSTAEKGLNLAKKTLDKAWKKGHVKQRLQKGPQICREEDHDLVKQGALAVSNAYANYLVEPPFACCKGYTCDDPNTPWP